jgi:hypothetical protein
MRKLIRALGSLLTILSLTVSVDTGAHPVAEQGVIGQARSAYYNLTSKGFKGFTATVEPNWKVILADTGTKENLKVFSAVRFSMVVAANGDVAVRHSVSANATKPNLQPFINKIDYDVERLISGFFNTWRIFMVSSPFPETEEIKIENSGAEKLLSFNIQSGKVTILTTGEFLITEWNLTAPTGKRTVKPRFQKTVDGFLLTGYQSVFEPINAGIMTTLDFNIEYQDVDGMKLPHKVRFSGMHGTEPVEAELIFRVAG